MRNGVRGLVLPVCAAAVFWVRRFWEGPMPACGSGTREGSSLPGQSALPGQLRFQFGHARAARIEAEFRKCPDDMSVSGEGERVVALCVDLRDSTTLLNCGAVNTAQFGWLLHKLFTIIRNSVVNYDGVVGTFTGDGGMGFFLRAGEVLHDKFCGRNAQNPTVRATWASLEIAREFQELAQEDGGFQEHRGGAAAAYVEVDLGISVAADRAMFGGLGPRFGRSKNCELPWQWHAVGRAPSLAARVCAWARKNTLERVYAQSESICTGSPRGPLIGEFEAGRAPQFVEKGWAAVKDALYPRATILLDQSVLHDPELASRFKLVELPIRLIYKGFPLEKRRPLVLVGPSRGN